MLSFLEAVIGKVLAGNRLRECGRAGTSAPGSPRPGGERAVSSQSASPPPRSTLSVPLETPWEWGSRAAPPGHADRLCGEKGQVELRWQGPAGCSPAEISKFSGTSYLNLNFFFFLLNMYT